MGTRKMTPSFVPSTNKTRFKTLIWDLETAGVGGLNADQGFIVCFGYKWHGETAVKCLTLLDYPGKNCQDDTNLIKAAYDIIVKADLSVAHFGGGFDRPYLNSRLIRAGLAPLPQTRLVDTCIIARHQLKLSSNRLAAIAKFFDLDTKKMEKGNGWPNWWMGAMRGDRKSILMMSKYCKQDVQCLDEVYEAMRTIIPGKYMISAAIGLNRKVCHNCGGPVSYRGVYFSAHRMYRRYQCRACGRWGHDPKAVEKVLI